MTDDTPRVDQLRADLIAAVAEADARADAVPRPGLDRRTLDRL
jgi:hypothetical protein